MGAPFLALLLGIVCARFRDVVQIVGALMQIAFFMTPVIWKPESISKPSILPPRPMRILRRAWAQKSMAQPIGTRWGMTTRPIGAAALLRRYALIYGIGGIVAPFVGINCCALPEPL